MPKHQKQIKYRFQVPVEINPQKNNHPERADYMRNNLFINFSGKIFSKNGKFFENNL